MCKMIKLQHYEKSYSGRQFDMPGVEGLRGQRRSDMSYIRM